MHKLSIAFPSDNKDLYNVLVFSTLLIYSRNHDVDHVGLRYKSIDQLLDSFLSIQFAQDMSMDEAFQAMESTGTLTDGCQEINCLVELLSDSAEKQLDFASINNATLSFKSIEAGRSELSFFSAENSNLGVVEKDFLEKVESIVKTLADSPSTLLSELTLVTNTSREILPDPSIEIPYRIYAKTPEVFLSVAEQYPLEKAISNGKQYYDYQALKQTSQFLANQLITAGLKQGDTVLVTGVSCFGTIAGFLSVMLAGGVLVSLDPNLPEDRRKQIVGLSDAKFAIVASAENTINTIDTYLPNETILIEEWPESRNLQKYAESPALNVSLPEDASAYLFFTSGSTGQPKGVLGTHAGLAHFLDWQRTEFPLAPGDRSAQLTALSFDVVLRDILYPLTSGACIYIPERSQIFDAQKILAWMHASQITIMHCVPSLMKAWLQFEINNKPFESLKYIFFAGEPLTDQLINSFKAYASPEVNITNLYGPTETTLAKLSNKIIEVEPGVQAIGYPQPEVDVLIVRDRKTLCGLNEVGEIAIRTPYRSKGYFKNPELTEEVFIQNPWRNAPGDLLYLTGDLGSYRPDGKVQIYGRIDGQIKIRGVRIEPNEIEAHILNYPGVSNAGVTTRIGPNEEKVLYAFVESKKGELDIEAGRLNREIRDYLNTLLPDAMIPKRFIVIDAIPHLPNGKINRKQLAALEIKQNADDVDIALDIQDEVTANIVEGLESVLAFRITDLNDSFVDLGGDSLSFIRASMVIQKNIGWLPDGWEKLPIKEVCGLEKKKATLISQIDTSILLRAIAIILIPIGHFTSLAIPTTNLLFIVSGYSLGKFQLPHIINHESVASIYKLMAKIAIPTFLFTVLKQVYDGEFILVNLLFSGALFPASVNLTKNFWFIDILLQCLLILSLLLSIKTIRNAFVKSPLGASIVFIAANLLLNYFLRMFGIYSQYNNGIYPTDFIWLILIGVLLAKAHDASADFKKTLITFLSIFGLYYVSKLIKSEVSFVLSDIYLLIPLSALIFYRKLPILTFLSKPITYTASASLFIYITHYAIGMRIEHLFSESFMWLFILVLIVAGIASKRLYDQFEKVVSTLFKHISKK